MFVYEAEWGYKRKMELVEEDMKTTAQTLITAVLLIVALVYASEIRCSC